MDDYGERVASRFWLELQKVFKTIGEDPKRSHIDGFSGLRRVNLDKFPFHILFEELEDRTRIQVLRHHARKPTCGLRRQWG